MDSKTLKINEILSQNISLNNLKKLNILNNNILNYIDFIVSKKFDENFLKQSYLSKTMYFIWLLDKFFEEFLISSIDKYIFYIDFETFDYIEFVEYFDFLEQKDFIDFDVKQTSSTFIKKFKSNNFLNISLLQIEFFNHEDDSDYSQYFLVINNN